MEFDETPAEWFLSYADGDRPLDAVWGHPAYRDVVQPHADLLGRDLDREAVRAAMDGRDTAFGDVSALAENRAEVESLLSLVEDRAADWVAVADSQLERITPEAELSEVPVYLAIGYEFGIGLGDGAFVDVNEPLFFQEPRQLLYVAIHESSHVLYDRVHGFSEELGAADLTPAGDQELAFETLFHTEAYATFTPLSLRRDDDALGRRDHLVCADYAVLDDDDRLADLVAEYDAFRERLAAEGVAPAALLEKVFGPSRLPYRVGCVLLDRLERTRGIDAVRRGFHLDPATFLSEYDHVLDPYRSPA